MCNTATTPYSDIPSLVRSLYLASKIVKSHLSKMVRFFFSLDVRRGATATTTSTKAFVFAFARGGEAVAKLADFSQIDLRIQLFLCKRFTHVQMESAKKKSDHVDG